MTHIWPLFWLKHLCWQMAGWTLSSTTYGTGIFARSYVVYYQTGANVWLKDSCIRFQRKCEYLAMDTRSTTVIIIITGILTIIRMPSVIMFQLSCFTHAARTNIFKSGVKSNLSLWTILFSVLATQLTYVFDKLHIDTVRNPFSTHFQRMKTKGKKLTNISPFKTEFRCKM